MYKFGKMDFKKEKPANPDDQGGDDNPASPTAPVPTTGGGGNGNGSGSGSRGGGSGKG